MKISKKRRLAVYNKYDGRCAYCGDSVTYEDFQPDHIISRSYLRGLNYRDRLKLGVDALDSLANLNPSCKECNRQKWDRGVEGFREYIEKTADTITDNPKAGLLSKYGLIEINRSKVYFHFELVGNE